MPLDTHPIVLYYNRDLLKKAGMLGDDGRPKGMASKEEFTATLQALKDSGVEFPLGSVTADGNFMFRTIYSLMCQQGGQLMTDGKFLTGDNGEKLKNALASCRTGPRRVCNQPTPIIQRQWLCSPPERRR